MVWFLTIVATLLCLFIGVVLFESSGNSLIKTVPCYLIGFIPLIAIKTSHALIFNVKILNKTAQTQYQHASVQSLRSFTTTC